MVYYHIIIERLNKKLLREKEISMPVSAKIAFQNLMMNFDQIFCRFTQSSKTDNIFDRMIFLYVHCPVAHMDIVVAYGRI